MFELRRVVESFVVNRRRLKIQAIVNPLAGFRAFSNLTPFRMFQIDKNRLRRPFVTDKLSPEIVPCFVFFTCPYRFFDNFTKIVMKLYFNKSIFKHRQLI